MPVKNIRGPDIVDDVLGGARLRATVTLAACLVDYLRAQQKRQTGLAFRREANRPQRPGARRTGPRVPGRGEPAPASRRVANRGVAYNSRKATISGAAICSSRQPERR